MKNKLLCLAFVLLVSLAFPGAGFCDEDVEIEVVRGDNLINVCSQYLDDPDEWPEVAEVNRIADPHWIYPGERLTIPARLLKGVPADGVVSFLKGEVMIQRGAAGEWVPLRMNERVSQESRIRTGAESAVELVFEDGSSFLLRAATSLGINKARKRGESYFMRELFLQGGRVITRIKRSTGRDSRFKIRTPSATAAVRGTDFRVSSDNREDTRIEVLTGTVSAEARRRQVLLNQNEGTLVRKGVAPLPPRKLLQAPLLIDRRDLYRRLPLEFRFGSVPGAVAYRVMLAVDPDFKNLVHDELFRPADSVQIKKVADGTYFLQARSVDSVGLEGPPSETVPIRVRVNPLPPFVQTPVDGQEYRSRTMQFEWLKVSDAVKYQVQLAQDPSFKNILEEQDALKGVAYKTGTLGPANHFFRIRSLAADGFQGEWSDVLRFAIAPLPPTPSADSPQMDKKHIRMRWKNMGEGVTYHFQMAADENFGEIVVDKKLKESEVTVDKPKKSGTYYVRVSGIAPDGFEGDFSPPQSFKVKSFKSAIVASVMTIGAILLVVLP